MLKPALASLLIALGLAGAAAWSRQPLVTDTETSASLTPEELARWADRIETEGSNVSNQSSIAVLLKLAKPGQPWKAKGIKSADDETRYLYSRRDTGVFLFGRTVDKVAYVFRTDANLNLVAAVTWKKDASPRIADLAAVR